MQWKICAKNKASVKGVYKTRKQHRFKPEHEVTGEKAAPDYYICPDIEQYVTHKKRKLVDDVNGHSGVPLHTLSNHSVI